MSFFSIIYEKFTNYELTPKPASQPSLSDQGYVPWIGSAPACGPVGPHMYSICRRRKIFLPTRVRPSCGPPRVCLPLGYSHVASYQNVNSTKESNVRIV